MAKNVIWLHDEALRLSHPVFSAAPSCTKALFIWDDTYLRESDFSLKRLVFICEALCELSCEVIQGKTLSVLQELGIHTLYVPYSNSPFVKNIILELSKIMQVLVVEDEPFVTLPESSDFKRFFQYWNRAQKTAFMQNGYLDAEKR